MDVELPGQVRGWQALAALKADAETKHIPVVAYADLDFPWYVPDQEHSSLERACLELADAYLQPHRLCYEVVTALESVGIEVHSPEHARSTEDAARLHNPTKLIAPERPSTEERRDAIRGNLEPDGTHT
jgi:hypothetical protein